MGLDAEKAVQRIDDMRCRGCGWRLIEKPKNRRATPHTVVTVCRNPDCGEDAQHWMTEAKAKADSAYCDWLRRPFWQLFRKPPPRLE